MRWIISKTKRIAACQLVQYSCVSLFWRLGTITGLSVVLLLGGLRPANAQSLRNFELQAISPDFWTLIDHDVKLTQIAAGFGFSEGPVWDESGFLYVSDETLNKIFRVRLNGQKEEVIALGDPDGNTFDRRRRLIDCASELRAIVEITPVGNYKMLADRYEGKRLNTPNDIVLGPDGALYFTDPTLDFVPGEKQELPFQGVYRLSQDGELKLLTKDLTQPNGIAFSSNGKRLYVDDSEQRNSRVYDVLTDGNLKNGRIFGEEPGGKNDGVPDGMKLDEKGNIFVTGPGAIWIWDAEGHHLGTVIMPEQPANLSWGDAQYRSSTSPPPLPSANQDPRLCSPPGKIARKAMRTC